MGQCGGLDCFSPPAPSPIPISSIPSGLWCLTPLLGGLGWGRVWGLLLASPCAHHGAGSVLESLTWSQEHPCTSCPGCLPHPKSRVLGTATPLPCTGMCSGCWCSPPPWAASQDCLTGLWGCSRLPLFPQPCTQGSPWVMKAEALGQPSHSKGSWGCAQPWVPGLPQLLPRLQSSGKGGLGHRRGGSSRSLAQASLWSCATLGWHLLRVHV